MEFPAINFSSALPDFLVEINRQLERRSVKQVLKLALGHFKDDIAMTTAFGASGMVLLHHLLPLKPDIKIHFLDTGYHFTETLEFAERLRSNWNLNLEIKRPTALDNVMGKRPFEVDPDRCCQINKVEPLLSIVYQQSAWISAIRRDQSVSRQHLDVVEIDRRGTIKVSPLINWTSRDIWQYINDHDIPVHPLYEKGFPSIGCEPCTSRVAQSGQERDGRWKNSSKVECGIHDHIDWRN